MHPLLNVELARVRLADGRRQGGWSRRRGRRAAVRAVPAGVNDAPDVVHPPEPAPVERRACA